MVFPAIFLAWLIEVASAIPQYSKGVGLVTGYVILAAFCVCYVITVPASWRRDDRRSLVLMALLAALFLAELPFAHADAFIMGVFVSVVAVIKYGERGSRSRLCSPHWRYSFRSRSPPGTTRSAQASTTVRCWPSPSLRWRCSVSAG